MEKNTTLKFTLRFIAIVQFVLGLSFLLAPELTAHTLGLSAAPEWTNWLFGMMAARFLGFGYGMLLAAQNPWESRHWIKAMIVIQAIDWIVTLVYLQRGAVSLMQVSTASFLPLIFIILLWLNYPRAVGKRSAA
ncbi:MAG: hypothetical protein HY066_05455 [Betaproteobacteria bacterium]|nr:hypothetical protein [Betaproteobacteria bacterium]